MTILVVGGAGFIGSHICMALKNAGLDPVVFDNLSTGHPWAVQFGKLIQGTIENEKALREAFEEVKPQAVIHLASLTSVRDSINNPAVFYENLLGTLTLLKMMVQQNVKEIVFSSSAAVYGEPKYTPIDENHPKEPLNAYGRTKLAVEGMLRDFSSAHGLSYAALRYFNACGADPKTQIGEAHLPETHLIPLAIRTAMGEESVLKIYGDTFATKDGTAVRDYVHVVDLASAHVQALEYLLKKKTNLTVNLGSGRGYSVKEIIDEVEKFSGKRVKTTILPRFKHDTPVLIADASLAQKLLHWKPQYSDLPTIIETAWKWHEAFSIKPLQKLKELREKSDLLAQVKVSAS